MFYAQAFIGQKYGPHTPIRAIPAEEYENIRLAMETHRSRDTRNRALLDQWYQKDDNNIPPLYVIRSASDLIPGLNSVSINLLLTCS